MNENEKVSRAGQVVIGAFTGECYRVLEVRQGIAKIQSDGGPVENWTVDGLHRAGYRLTDREEASS